MRPLSAEYVARTFWAEVSESTSCAVTALRSGSIVASFSFDTAACAGKPGTPRCNLATNTCVACLGDGDCTSDPLRRHCKTSTNQCVECNQNADCGQLCVCSSRNLCLCKDCNNDSQCGSGKCLGVTGGKTCVQTCSQNTDCPAQFDCGNVAAGYCAPSELVSCQALYDLRQNDLSTSNCSQDNDCGVNQDNHQRDFRTCPQNSNTVFCRMAVTPHICTYRCDDGHDCPAGYKCETNGFCLSSWCIPQ